MNFKRSSPPHPGTPEQHNPRFCPELCCGSVPGSPRELFWHLQFPGMLPGLLTAPKSLLGHSSTLKQQARPPVSASWGSPAGDAMVLAVRSSLQPRGCRSGASGAAAPALAPLLGAVPVPPEVSPPSRLGFVRSWTRSQPENSLDFFFFMLI